MKHLRVMPTVSRGEVAAVLLWSAVVMAATAVPYAIAESWAGSDRHFAGFIWGADEGNVYLSWIRQYRDGAWLAANQYTTRQQRPCFFNVFLWALGRLSRLTGLTPLQVFHLARLAAIPVAVYCFYCLVAYLTEVRLVRAAALAISCASSGFGWLFVLAAYSGARPRVYPIDCAAGWQAMPEAVTFLSFLLNPLFTASLALMCASLLWGWRALENSHRGQAVTAGLALLALGNIHSYDIFAVHGALLLWAAYLVLSGRARLASILPTYLLIWAVAAPAPIWSWFAAHHDPAYMAKVATPTLSPRPIDYAAGYGLVGLAAALGAYAAVRMRAYYHRSMAALGWAVVTFVLVYAPVSFQRKMAEGGHLALGYLAALAVALGLPWLLEMRWPKSMPANARYRKRKRLVLAFVGVFLALTVPSNVVFVFDALSHVAVNNADLYSVLMPPAYLTRDEVRALQWLGQRASFSDIVLSSSLMGNHIPAWSAARVYVGHWAETLDFRAAAQTAAMFYAPGLLPETRAQILKDTGATFVWWGQYERLLQRAMLGPAQKALGPSIPFPDPPDTGLPALRVAFRSGEVTLYRVIPPVTGTAQ